MEDGIARNTEAGLPTREASHRPYASMNWIRFNGSLRRESQQYLSPLPGLPW